MVSAVARSGQVIQQGQDGDACGGQPQFGGNDVERLLRQPAQATAEGDPDVHQTTLSHHYRVLREAGVTWTTVQGRSRLVRLRRDDLDALFPGLLDSVLTVLARTHEPANPH
ncbi:ArsR/SmtB family transcription factor [Spirillospora sp. NPDC048911]|uniref:ArsR/SmtB family transcription factor n=1 Tax=Spirillospora sp. NPDC048911 TaxID=3364527 RepID=UPI0037229B2D